MRCLDCGNERHFFFRLEGTDEVEVDPETGEIRSVERIVDAFDDPSCSQCNGQNVVEGGMEAR